MSSVYYKRLQLPKHDYNSNETPIQFNSIQYASPPILTPSRIPPSILHAQQCSTISMTIQGCKVHQILIAQHPLGFPYRMRLPSCRNTRQASTRLCNVSENSVAEGLRRCFLCNCPLFNTRLETNYKISSCHLPDNCRSERSCHRDDSSCNCCSKRHEIESVDFN